MMRFSLITVTMGVRERELANLSRSIALQGFRDVEHIVVDQREHPEFGGSLSCARNYGMSLARGEIIAFPDDDAWYPEGTFQAVLDMFEDREVDGVSFRVVDDRGRCSAGGYMSSRKMRVTRKNVWCTAVSCSFFLRRQRMDALCFDVNLGAGTQTRFGSGEETDFLLKLIDRGLRIEYDGTCHIGHVPVCGRRSPVDGWRYGNGCGAVLRRHGYSVVRLFWMVGLQMVRSLQACVLLSPGRVVFHVAMAVGRIAGYVYPAGKER